jgi:hypothetical protein
MTSRARKHTRTPSSAAASVTPTPSELVLLRREVAQLRAEIATNREMVHRQRNPRRSVASMQRTHPYRRGPVVPLRPLPASTRIVLSSSSPSSLRGVDEETSDADTVSGEPNENGNNDDGDDDDGDVNHSVPAQGQQPPDTHAIVMRSIAACFGPPRVARTVYRGMSRVMHAARSDASYRDSGY